MKIARRSKVSLGLIRKTSFGEKKRQVKMLDNYMNKHWRILIVVVAANFSNMFLVYVIKLC